MPDRALAAAAAPQGAPGSGAAGASEHLAAAGAWGRIHSVTTGSMVDGPGVRTVVWTTGCEMRCLYCHNPDTWTVRSGEPTEAEALVKRVARHKRFMAAAGGGVTVTGGEPLVQSRFVVRVLRGCQAQGLHTALDTNGYLGDRLSDEELAAADLVLLDLKSFDPETHLKVTGREVEPVLAFARRLAERRRPTWLRFVLVPGLTDAPANVEGLAAFASSLGNVERVDVLPFHQMGRAKWKKLGLRYALDGVRPPAPEAVERVREVFRARGLTVV
ncbi:MAG: pyruvate formate-lyase-activating protein [Anaeromyxobacter sp.]